ncbi:MAG TPA: hypothetical protein VKR80_07580 [Candidatus Limnocylindria bacterium]|nr:hypothetical protein [Candidatus Limnocylindria bacterium]
MATQTRIRLSERPLDVVLRPLSEAEASYRSTVLAPGFVAEPGLDLRYLGGRLLPQLTFTLVYLGQWDPRERTKLDAALAAAMVDKDLNNVLAQYFPGQRLSATFAGSEVHGGPTPARVYRDTVESLVGALGVQGVACLLLPRGAVLVDGTTKDSDVPDSRHGLGGYHGSVNGVYYVVAVYSEGGNGIVAFDESWKNVCATLYHELQETRTDPDVEDAIRAGSTPAGEHLLGWYSPRGGEIGDIPLAVAHDPLEVLREVPLANGSGSVPIQLMWSNAVGGPEGPISRPHPQK